MNEPTISIWVLALPAFIATVFLFFRLTGFLNRRFVFFLFIYGFLFFWMKEFLQAKGMFLNHVYSFSGQSPLRLFGVPLVGIIGHLFTFGLSLSIGVRILQRLHLPANVPFVLSVCYAVSMAIAYMVEPGGSVAGWWYWGYGDNPWWEVPDLQWMGEVSLGIVSFQRDSIGDVPACLLAGWPVGISLFLFPLLLFFRFSQHRLIFLKYAGFLLVVPIMLLAEIIRPVVPATLIGMLLLGLGAKGNSPVLPATNSSKKPESAVLIWLKEYGDYPAFLIFFLIIALVELRLGVAALYLPTWLPLSLYVLFSRMPKKPILGIVILICLVAVTGYFVSFSARWMTPFQVVYFITVGFMLPAYLIYRWSANKRIPKGKAI